MANNIDFSSLKARAIGSGLDEEAVTVNTRALIDKVLARYSGEWTVLRELLQNAADASATQVVIKIETLPSATVPTPAATDDDSSIKHVISHHTVQRLTLRNNGATFNANDWNRLKRIAEGNPDETKIGAFGVGFYSVFSDCEEPFVSSGREAMAFYWKENALFTRRLQLDERDCSNDTTFVLDYRNTTSPVPGLTPLCQFLASSLTFVGLESIELWLDNWNLLKLSKKLAPSAPIAIPNDISPKTLEGMMKINTVTRQVAQLDASCMKAVSWTSPANSSRYEGNKKQDTTASLRGFFSRLTGSSTSDDKKLKPEAGKPTEGLLSYKSSTVFFHITTGHIGTSVSSSFSRELERATKKPPPKNTKLSILTSSCPDPQDRIKSPDTFEIFNSVLPSQGGRIYIGFPTHQTTGLNAHVSAPSLIPTVERESIDLNARWVRTWNLELLNVVGIVCRVAWAAEMAALKDQLLFKLGKSGRSKLQIDDVDAVLMEAIHTSNQFVFQNSTPNAQIGETIEDSFWKCSRNAYLEILSTVGILPSHQVRIAQNDLSFLDGIPVLPDRFAREASRFVRRLMDVGLINEVTMSDIKRELENRPLSSSQLREFLAWIAKKSANGQIDRNTVQSFLGAAIANDLEEGGNSAPIVLKDITNFVNAQRIPPEMPMPPFVLPFKYSKDLSPSALSSMGWQELNIYVWIRWLVQSASNRNYLTPEQDITASPTFSARVFPILSKQWESLPANSRTDIAQLLQNYPVIPTKFGMKKPDEAYFSSVRIFDDLPTITGFHGVKEKVLISLGVRKTVDINIIFERLLNTESDENTSAAGAKSKWSYVELVRYLTSVRHDIPDQDLLKLRQAKICTAEIKTNGSTSSQRYRVDQLFEPKDPIRELGFPILHWPGKYPWGTQEALFLTSLGLKAVPTSEDMLGCMAGAAAAKDTRILDQALRYFIAQHVTNGYSSFDCSTIQSAFLPTEGGGMSSPSQCFTVEGASLLDFKILRKDLHPHASKFGVKQHPPINDCINVLTLKPPQSKQQARTVFEYMAGRVAELNSTFANRLGSAHIVPTQRSVLKSLSEKRLTSSRLIAPRDCYLGDSDDYGEIFDFVDFGKEANLFLLACGSKNQPTFLELASILVKEPTRILSKLQSHEKYLKLLQNIAASMSNIKRDQQLFKQMKTSPFLLASKQIPVTKPSKKVVQDLVDFSDEEEDQSISEWHFVKATDAVIIDDYSSFNLFKENILAAPQEELIEDMYASLGTPALSKLVDEKVQCGSPSPDQYSALKLQKHIYERSRLLLHDLPPKRVKRDARWLESQLTVRAVKSLKLRRQLRGLGISHVEDRGAAMVQDSKGLVLCISKGGTDLYQVSQAVAQIILVKPNLHSTLTLEMLLKTDLLELRTRGYNVERILRRKAAEARMAEQKRQHQLDEELAARRQIHANQQQQQQQQEEENGMPGDFPDSPKSSSGSHKRASSTESQGQQGTFADFTKRLGISSYLRRNSLKNVLQGNTKKTLPDTPESEEDKPRQHISPEALKSQLQSAVKSSRPFNRSTLRSQGQKKQLEEKRLYCDERSAHDLAFFADTEKGVKTFISKRWFGQEPTFEQCKAGMEHFAALLIDCSLIFGLPKNTIHIFYENTGKTIAFNSNGSIFCNYSDFEKLHLRLVSEGSRSEALTYWFVILCHELAHNIVSDHGSKHGFYTESLVTEYFHKCVQIQATGK
ncbi:hypothetical protein FQN57_001230 [Myotisia sp. PD_48]|nr:hypothetical protein FQN57_001230 [Myotisia sp. PD_48]